MKQLYILLFILTSSNVFAQKIPWKTDLKLSAGTKYVHVSDPYNDIDEEYFFDKEGKLEKYVSIIKPILNNKQIFRSQFFYEGILLMKRENFYNNRLYDVIKYDYEEGKLILDTEIDVEEKVIRRQKSYCYSDGKLSSKLVVASDGIDVTEINYTENGSMIETKEYYGEDELVRILKEVKKDNIIVNESYAVNYDGVLAQPEIRKYVYDKNQNLIVESYSHYNKYDNKTNVYTYNDNIITNTKYFDEKDKLWMEEFYDSKGNLAKEVRPAKSNVKEEITLFENYYNRRGDLIKVKRLLYGRMSKVKYNIKYW